jgi:hypothetical protein
LLEIKPSNQEVDHQVEIAVPEAPADQIPESEMSLVVFFQEKLKVKCSLTEKLMLDQRMD